MRAFPTIPGQRGLATREQLREAGWTDGAVRTLLRSHGQRPFPGVYAPHRGGLSPEDRLVAAALWAGERAALTGLHGLRLMGVEVSGAADVPMRFLIPDGLYAAASEGAIARRTTRWPRTRTLDGIRVAGLERCLADYSRYHDGPAHEASALTIAALQRGLTSVERLRAQLGGGRLNDTAPVRAGLREFEAGAWSAAEAKLRALLSMRRRPFVMNTPLWRPDGTYLGTPDAYLPQFGIEIQVHSRRYHTGLDESGRDLWSLTVEADARYSAAGILVVGVTPSTLRRSPARFLRLLEDAVATRVGLPRPAVVLGVHRTTPSETVRRGGHCA